ncbi:MAG TPA: hypothetical protein DCE52_07375 [Rhodobacteraceae bacterium]|nr:hypothetical protein [Paracoccaceae bacterium]
MLASESELILYALWMNEPPPEISVIISTYNDRALLEKKLNEILRQTFFDRAEFIFVEPASPGGERILLEPFCSKHANCRLLALDERVRLYSAWNLGWEAAQGEFVCISNMDDSMHPDLLRQVTDEMRSNQWDLASVLITKQLLGTDWPELEGRRTRALTLSTRPGPFFAWRRELKDTLGMFEDRMLIAGDKDFWARAADARLRIGLVPGILYIYSKHPGQLSKDRESEKAKAADLKIANEKSYPHVWPESIQREVRYQRMLQYFIGWQRVNCASAY